MGRTLVVVGTFFRLVSLIEGLVLLLLQLLVQRLDVEAVLGRAPLEVVIECGSIEFGVVEHDMSSLWE
ncbi:hypothetical protein [Nocardioides salsibiostraticola]